MKGANSFLKSVHCILIIVLTYYYCTRIDIVTGRVKEKLGGSCFPIKIIFLKLCTKHFVIIILIFINKNTAFTIRLLSFSTQIFRSPNETLYFSMFYYILTH